MNLKIVRCMGREGLVYSVRLDEEGIETELICSDKESEAEQIKSVLNAAARDPATTLQSIAVLIQIHRYAYDIALATDQQGESSYATKAHMRRWGESIFKLAGYALKSCGIQMHPEKVIVPTAGPVIASDRN